MTYVGFLRVYPKLVYLLSVETVDQPRIGYSLKCEFELVTMETGQPRDGSHVGLVLFEAVHTTHALHTSCTCISTLVSEKMKGEVAGGVMGSTPLSKVAHKSIKCIQL